MKTVYTINQLSSKKKFFRHMKNLDKVNLENFFDQR